MRRDYVRLTPLGVYIWTEAGADHLKESKTNVDPNRTTPALHCEFLAKQLNASDVVALAGGSAR